MASTRLRQQGGAVVLTIPSEIAARAGWTVGIELNVTAEGESVNIVPVTRVPRGHRTVAQLPSCWPVSISRKFNSITKRPPTG
ncbi:antitoxin ChpS [Candidatus Pantoea varia]|uniref:Antitoxin ChpS n=1 Tax=Candidatus Pantoea varia TaxID=1881036 RepID=A0A1I5ELG7_9GAMM|nr:antitoxin ChpS [Pantoea varia]